MPTIWIDADECMGAGTCSQIAPLLFAARPDGTWTVREDERYFGRTTVFDGGDGPEGRAGQARIPEELVEAAYEAAEECPGECIHIER